MDTEIAKTWLLLKTTKKGSHEYEEHFWAFEKLCDLCEEDPDRAFAIVREIMRLDSSDMILAGVAAGPMED